MIVPMVKYDIVLLRSEKEKFLGRLQDLGLMDITTTGWEPDERERELVQSVEKHNAALARLRGIAGREGFEPGEPYNTGDEAWQHYLEASSGRDAVAARIAQAEKEAAEARVWGMFDVSRLKALEESGVQIRYFSIYTKEFEAGIDAWSSRYNVVGINEDNGVTYFVVVAAHGEEISINAHEIKAPAENYREREMEISRLEMQAAGWDKVLARVAASLPLLEQHTNREKESLSLSRVSNTAREEADGTLVILEGWAAKETGQKVDRMLEENPAIVYLKSEPTPEDETPVLLRNNKFARAFEFIGNFYSLPLYGTTDLTSLFAPFYMLFFGLCLADAGYGLLFVAAGIYMTRKLKPGMKGVGRLITLCGLSTVVCGALMGSFFGIAYTDYEPFAAFRSYILSSDNIFPLSLEIGILQILFGMAVKVYTTTRRLGFRYALSTIGWMMAVICGMPYMLLYLGVDWFETVSPLFLVGICVGAFMMLFLNSPGKNLFVNFGAGLWNTYNDVTGLLGDVLSYIRLFANGLSGGILASVFNQLAVGLSPDIPVVKQFVMILILVIGHGMNLFMSTLSSFVHPMRLTFVEFYKNAGFETATREFQPLRREGERE